MRELLRKTGRGPPSERWDVEDLYQTGEFQVRCMCLEKVGHDDALFSAIESFNEVVKNSSQKRPWQSEEGGPEEKKQRLT